MPMEVELDPDDFNAKGLRKLLKAHSQKQLPRHKRDAETNEKLDKEDDEESEALADLMNEQGDGKPPKVTKDDIEAEDKKEDDDKEEEEEE